MKITDRDTLSRVRIDLKDERIIFGTIVKSDTSMLFVKAGRNVETVNRNWITRFSYTNYASSVKKWTIVLKDNSVFRGLPKDTFASDIHFCEQNLDELTTPLEKIKDSRYESSSQHYSVSSHINESNSHKFVSNHRKWWYRKYGVEDINLLSKTQLEESLAKAKSVSNIGIGCDFVGVICIFWGLYFLTTAINPGPIGFIAGLDDIHFIILSTAGALTIIPGSIITYVNSHRIKLIKPLLNNYDKEHGSLSVSPTILLNSYAKSYVLGFAVTLKF